MTEQASVDDLRQESQRVIEAIYPAFNTEFALSEWLDGLENATPATCTEGGAWQIRAMIEGAGITDPDAFLEDLYTRAETADLLIVPSLRNGVLDGVAYFNMRTERGDILTGRAGGERAYATYKTRCSTDQSLRDALDEAVERHVGAPAETVKPKPSKWGIRG